MKRTALVSGASSGIGLELARVLAAEGHDLVILARSKKKLEELAKELKNQYGVEVSVLAKDLSQANAAQEIYDELQKKKIQIDILINNAGLGSYGSFVDTDPKQDATLMQVNIVALTELNKAFIPDMKARKWGRIMNVGSIASFIPSPNLAVYAASKAYVLSLSEALNIELYGSGVKVSALCPGVTKTNFFEAANISEDNVKQLGDFFTQTAEEVARSGYKAMMAGKNIHITGLVNNVSVNSYQWIPRPIRNPILGTFYSFFGRK